MAVVLSREALIDPAPGGWWPTASYGQMRLYNDHYFTYAALYREQPNVRTCVDFLARNVAQLGLHVFRRISDTDRQRLGDHPLAALLGAPNNWTTRYRLIQALMSDMGIYFNAYWIKMQFESGLKLLSVPPTLVTVHGGLAPSYYEVALGSGAPRKVPPENMVHFRGYNPESCIEGLSPLETLRRILAEEYAMGRYREGFWANAARISGLIERPVDAPEWSDDARERFRAEFEALYSGEDPERNNSGKTAILEEGMTWKEASFNAEESEYLGGRRLTREECARAYHIPLPMVGILDHATFSNIREQHKNLYQDSLGPWLKMIEEEIELQLLPDLGDTAGVYCEFNIAEKLAGSFEEQTASLQSAVGRPWMTADEARARMNLPSMGGDAAELVTPLNVLVGGQASPTDGAPDEVSGAQARADVPSIAPGLKARGQIDPTLLELRARHVEQWQRVLEYTFGRQRRSVMSKLPKKALPMVIEELWDAKRWNGELADDYYRLNAATARVWAEYVAEQLDHELDVDRMAEWLRENARISAEEINGHTRDQIAQALAIGAGAEAVYEAVGHLFDLAVQVRAPELAVRAVTTASVFGSQEGASQGGLRTKTWQVNSLNPREAHAALDGETVAIDDIFSNGMRWPGDPAGGAENNANCQCSLRFGR